MNDIIAEKLKLLPDEPGVYKMYNGSGEIIYVGKAVNLKNRVRQYFQHTPKKTKKKNKLKKIKNVIQRNLFQSFSQLHTLHTLFP